MGCGTMGMVAETEHRNYIQRPDGRPNREDRETELPPTTIWEPALPGDSLSRPTCIGELNPQGGQALPASRIGRAGLLRAIRKPLGKQLRLLSGQSLKCMTSLGDHENLIINRQGRRTSPRDVALRAGCGLEALPFCVARALPASRAVGAPDVSDAEGLKRVYGIDLGTTYSAIAYVDEHGKAVIVPNQESERITPSVVLFDGDNIVVGNTAKESAKVEPHRVVCRIKQHMGDPNFVFQYEGQAFSPEDISSF